MDRYAYRSYPETRFASRGRDGAVSPQHASRHNHLLAALPLEDYERLLPDLEPVPLPLDWIVHGAGDREKYLYFLTAGIVSRFNVTENGASAEFAVTGSEGVIGVASFLGGESTPSQAVVVSAGYGYRLAAHRAKDEFDQGGPLSHLLLRYTQALIAQTAQVAVCNRHHSLEQRLCRWILSCLDRLPPNGLSMTQELIAEVLGRAPRRRHGGGSTAANGGTDPSQPRPHCRTRSPSTGSAGMRVLRGRQTGV